MEIIIWGCGRFGKLAYYYYNDNFNIIGFIDSDPTKWGTDLFDKTVYSPKILETFDGKVVIAVKNDYIDIRNILEETYGISEVILFKVDEKPLILEGNINNSSIVDERTIMIYFLGGLGNQMFQYALAKNYLMQKKKVIANVDHYCSLGKREFVLCDIFKNIFLNLGGDIQRKQIMKKNMDASDIHINFRVYREEMRNGMKKTADMSLLYITGGIIYGFHQNFRFAQKVENELRQDFIFNANADRKLGQVLNIIQELNCVGVHIRRGDYMAEKAQMIYGGICTRQYYDDAMKIMKNKIGTCVFCFFSNDMEWVKDHFKISNAIYIESNMFEDYQDWYDMYLMSHCKHNIIANSTFSWWGAWLNQNKEKIVIAPKKWVNTCDYIDIYPEDWICM